ncbi:hypothetical protein LUZ60_006510 [Juncus effusus]|nr:hypothetical protein LUZ60_006510 [Juncus effusus]
MKRIIIRERDEDYESQHKFRLVMDGEYLLKDAAKIYTRNIFNKFRVEMNEINFYRIIESSVCRDGTKSFIIGSNKNEVEKFTVILNLQIHEGLCECQNFEFVGILCRHVLKVLHRYDVYTIPAHFVLPRWMKKANKFLKIDCEEGLMQNDDNSSAALIFSHIVQESTKLACVATQVSVSTQLSRCYRIVMDGLKDIHSKVEDVLSEDVSHSSNVPPPIVQVDTEVETFDSSQVDEMEVADSSQVDAEIVIYDRNISQTKGSSGR